MKLEKTCLQCGKTFLIYPYEENRAKFCSRICQGKHRFIGNKFRQGKRPPNAFTSEQVRGENNPRWVEGQEFTCEHCNKVFKVKPWIVRQNGKARFCSNECWIASDNFIRGENHPHYVGGPETYRGKSWLKVRQLAVKRDNGTCQDCGKIIGNSIPVHHIKPFREFQSDKEANRLDNLVCLCQSCHMKREPHPKR